MNTGPGCTSSDGEVYYGEDSTITYDDGEQNCTANEP
jgi:hypothetical protein